MAGEGDTWGERLPDNAPRNKKKVVGEVRPQALFSSSKLLVSPFLKGELRLLEARAMANREARVSAKNALSNRL